MNLNKMTLEELKEHRADLVKELREADNFDVELELKEMIDEVEERMAEHEGGETEREPGEEGR